MRDPIATSRGGVIAACVEEEMKMRKLTILPILAIAFSLIVPGVQALDPDTEPSGDSCDSAPPLDSFVAGTIDPVVDEEDWYEIVVTSEPRTLKFKSTSPGAGIPALVLGVQQFRILDWDERTSSQPCGTWVSNQGCPTLYPLSSCFLGGDGGTVVLDEPGDYRLLVRTGKAHPSAYTVELE